MWLKWNKCNLGTREIKKFMPVKLNMTIFLKDFCKWKFAKQFEIFRKSPFWHSANKQLNYLVDLETWECFLIWLAPLMKKGVSLRNSSILCPIKNMQLICEIKLSHSIHITSIQINTKSLLHCQSVWKSPKKSHSSFYFGAYSANFCPIKIDLSGNTVWPQA